MNCKNHQDKQAGYQCAKCKNYFCEPCTDIRKISDSFTAYICKECGGKCDLIAESTSKTKLKNPFIKPAKDADGKIVEVKAARPKTPPGEQPRPVAKLRHANFWACLPGVLIFPFKGKGFLITFVMGAIIYGLFELSRMPGLHLEHLAASFIFAAYFSICLLNIIEDSFHGSTRLEGLPGKDYWAQVGGPVFNLFCAVAIFLFPAQIYFLQFKNFDWLYLVLLALGTFLFPMAIVSTVILRKLYSVNPLRVIASVFKAFFAYLIVCVLIAGLALLAIYLRSDYLSDYERYGQAAAELLIVYVLFVQARLIGLFARFYEGKIRVKTTGETS